MAILRRGGGGAKVAILRRGGGGAKVAILRRGLKVAMFGRAHTEGP